MGLLLWTLSTNDLTVNTLRLQVGSLVVRDLARPTLTVAPDLPLAEAIRRADEAEATGIVTVDARGTLVGVVSDAAVEATPAERRPWLATSEVAQAVTPEQLLAADITGDQLLAAISHAPMAEYLLVDAGGCAGGRAVPARPRPGGRTASDGGLAHMLSGGRPPGTVPRCPPPHPIPDVPDVPAAAWSGVHRGPLRAGEWVRLVDTKGRKHNICLEAGQDLPHQPRRHGPRRPDRSRGGLHDHVDLGR